MGSFSSN